MRKTLCFLCFVLPTALLAQRAPDSPYEFGPFFQTDFPFYVTTVNSDTLGAAYPARSLTVRGPVVRLGHDAFAVFDPDLLRLGAAWTGADALTLTTMAQVSYHKAGDKNNDIPRLQTPPLFVNGIYPGWQAGTPLFIDPRPAGPNPEEIGRGPIEAEQGRWNGLHVVGDAVVFDYTVRGMQVYEQLGSVVRGGEVGITRTFRLGRTPEALTLVVAEVGNGTASTVEEHAAWIAQGKDGATAAGLAGAPAGARFEVIDDRYLVLRLLAGMPASTFTLVTWNGRADHLGTFQTMLDTPVALADFEDGGPARWPQPEVTQGAVAPDTAAYVIDELTLPLPNRWQRNIRIADVDFFDDGRAAVVTFEGDVWIVSGIDDDLQELTWRRFASGLYETMSIEVEDGAIYTFGRGQITRLHDRNGDGEADFYENFSNLAVQTNESREFPLDMVARPGGGFYLAKGSALDNGPPTSPRVAPGFRPGGPHSGAIVEVAPDGRSVRRFATGFREPYIGIHPETGLLTASDQQGNFVPSSPIYVVREGGYYGVEPTAHRPLPMPVEKPLTWTPHRVDRSSTSQLWALSDRFGPLGGALIHLSYGEPAAFRMFVNEDTTQGGIIRLPIDFTAPVQKGAMNPQDGQLYIAGFQVWDSDARAITSLLRMRYTGQPITIPTDLRAESRGILLRFAQPLDEAIALDPENYSIARWNYKRTPEYGSGYYRLDGTEGTEPLALRPHLSADGRSVFLAVLDMQPVMQMEVLYDLATADGLPLDGAVYLTVNEVRGLDLAADGFGTITVPSPSEGADGPATTATAALGEQLYQQFGCAGCHSIDGSTEGRTGPTFQGLYGSERLLNEGSTVIADEDYLRESILDPAAKVAEGYHVGMASYRGVLTPEQIDALILFIQSLGSDE